MASSYSIDLRIRVINLIKQNKTQIFISELLNISTKTIQRWWKNYKESGNISPKKPITTKPRRVDYQKIKEYIDQNPDKTLTSVGEHFGCCQTAILYALRKSNYTYKKKISLRGEKGRFEKRVQQKD